MAPRSTGACIFCGDRDVTVEDAIPKGIARLYRTEGTTGRTRVASHQERDRRNYGVVFKVRGVVCRSCNNGWMSGLQREAQPMLKALSGGDRPVILEPSAQRVLTAWLTMTAMVTEWGDDRLPQPVYTRDERYAMREDHQFPNNSVAWAAQRLPMREPAVMYASKYLRVHTEPGRHLPHNGVAFTAVISRVVLQLMHLRVWPEFPWSEFVVDGDRTWSNLIVGMPQMMNVVWPPLRPLSEPAVRTFVERWTRYPPLAPPGGGAAAG